MCFETDCRVLCKTVFEHFSKGEKEFESHLIVLFNKVTNKSAKDVTNAINTCRRCLKFNRSASHPERMIGKNSDVKREIDDASLLIAGNMLILMRTLVNRIDIFLTRTYTVAPFSYFILSLFLDILKECRRCNDINLRASISQKCTVWLSTNMPIIVQYVPNLLRVADIIKSLYDHNDSGNCRYGDSANMLEMFVSAVLSTYPSHTLFDQPTDDSSKLAQSVCSLIDNDMLICSTGPALCVLLVEVILQNLEGVHLSLTSPQCGDIEVCEKMLRGAREMTDVFARLVRGDGFRQSVSSFVRSMSVGDKDLVRLLLCIEEIWIACDSLLGLKKRCDESMDFTYVSVCSLASSVSEHIQLVFSLETGLHMHCLFVHFLAAAVCFDVGTCMDLLTQSETEALKYFLKALRSLELLSLDSAHLLRVCGVCWLDQQAGKTLTSRSAAETCSRMRTSTAFPCGGHCILWVDAERVVTSSEVEHSPAVGCRVVDAQSLRERVHRLEWFCGGHESVAGEASPAICDHESPEIEIDKSFELYEIVISLLSDLRDTLEAVNVNGLTPFNCAPLVRRMSITITACTSGHVK